MISKEGRNLIFLISQPSSGSTLIQKNISNHYKIHSGPEPWILLQPFFSLKAFGVNAIYSVQTNNHFVGKFIEKNFHDMRSYFKWLGGCYTDLYNIYLKESSSAEFFLDKTPRYYLILDELYIAYPDAKFIILKRNPLSVFLSHLKVIKRENWQSHCDEFYADLILAINYINLFLNKYKKSKNVLEVFYEKYVDDYKFELRKIMEFLNLDYKEGQELYKSDEITKAGDNSGNIHKYKYPQKFISYEWLKKIDSNEKFYLMIEYLNFLGKVRVKDFGYEPEELSKALLDFKNKSKINKPFRRIKLSSLINSSFVT